MEATLYSVQGSTRNFAVSFAKIGDFILDEGVPASPLILVDEPYWTPYCLDDENRRVCFVKTPPEIDLAQAAFVYNTQAEHAQAALAVPYDVLDQLIDKLDAPEILIPIYSIGRCGSTLMSQIFNQIEDVYSLSEPDVFTNVSMIRSMDTSRDAELTQILKVCTLLLSRYGDNHRRPKAVVHKYRSHGLEICDLMDSVFPDARNIFMYRSAVSWAGSVFKFGQRLGAPSEMPRADALDLWHGISGKDPAYLSPYIDAQQETFYFSDLLALMWTSYLERYLSHYERDMTFHAIRYEELNSQREETLKAALDFCGLSVTAHLLEEAMKGFETESQAGTAVSSDIPADDLPPERIAAFLEMLSRHPRFNNPDFIAPDHRNA